MMHKLHLTGLNPTVIKVAGVQVVLATTFAAIALIWQGSVAGLSAICGGAIIVLGNIAYAFIARPNTVRHVSSNHALMRHVLAEVAKVLIVLALMLGAFTANKLDAVWLIAAVGVALFGHALSLLIVKMN